MRRPRFYYRTKSTARPFQARFEEDDIAKTPDEINKEIKILRGFNERSRDILYYGSKDRLQRMELNAWIGRNNARIKQLEKQRDCPALHEAQTGVQHQ